MASAPPCSDDSTTCLLQTAVALLQSINEQQNAYNWSPLNFAFTAGIGVLALGFTIVTITLGNLEKYTAGFALVESAIGGVVLSPDVAAAAPKLVLGICWCSS
jgi:hypothetical protein